MSITKSRAAFKPFQYQEFYDYWFKQQSSHWLHTEIPMQSDINDWQNVLSSKDKSIIGEILKGFAQTECEVGNYWSVLIPRWFPVHEVKMMAQTFAAWETIHAVAYSYLNDSLGLDDFESFLQDEPTMAKLEGLMKINGDTQWKRTLKSLPDGLGIDLEAHMKVKEWAVSNYSRTEYLQEIAKSVAVFSACAEGINLFSSFAVLLSFKKNNLMKGISKQIEYSVRDESMHSEAGIRLVRVLVDENPEIWTDELRKSIYEGVELSLNNECTYINHIFRHGEIESITKFQLINFMRDRANRKLVELGLYSKYEVDEVVLSEMDWFYTFVSGRQNTDFFANKVTDYSKPSEGFKNRSNFSFGKKTAE